MAGKRKRKAIRRRNPLVPATRKLGHGVKPSAKRYRRRPKHPEGAGSDPPEAGAGCRRPGIAGLAVEAACGAQEWGLSKISPKYELKQTQSLVQIYLRNITSYIRLYSMIVPNPLVPPVPAAPGSTPAPASNELAASQNDKPETDRPAKAVEESERPNAEDRGRPESDDRRDARGQRLDISA